MSSTTSSTLVHTNEATGSRTRVIGDVRPDRVARIRRPQVAKQPFSRLTDGIDHPVVTRSLWDEEYQNLANEA